MLRFLVKRLIIALCVAITVSIIGFSLLRLSGDLASVLAGENASPEDIARIAINYGLDRPFYIQYLDWVTSALHGDLGRSLFTSEPVSELIMDRIGVTGGLAISALLLALVVAVPLGVLAAVKANTWWDRAALIFSVAGQATPNFWLALIFILVFAVQLRWVPVSGSGSIAHFILPVVTLAVSIMPSTMRLTRAGMMEVLSSDYVRTARAKGLSPFKVLFKHALRNAILPVVSLAAVQLGFLLGGSVIVESIFALNGIGYLAFQSIVRVDFPVVQSILVFLSCAYIVLTLLSDLINAKLDPRVQLR
ncbi:MULTISPECIES: ABC transporter permease [unclassified Beijerinckia]|uniref:ABC transporter permease n=1 Tax=unclassified Beijerinckia TaxID=2638183 RepID=UPI000897D225|nr:MULTISPECIES: ABC transporter permease [unclassified Beijerinckia]MDH7799379.1 peptide/nickel transport system permease protein [Beijerinckia sp. GAS462]SED48255.1 peptide/nickel transport system permease protein [Beijerinckia sp. 28-YEA-48]